MIKWRAEGPRGPKMRPSNGGENVLRGLQAAVLRRDVNTVLILAVLVVLSSWGCQAQPRQTLPTPTVRPVVRYQRKPAAPRPAPRPQTVRRQSYLNGRTVVIDAGHGGHDPGTLGCASSRMPEKEIVLDVALQVAQALNGWGARVVNTRDRDVFIELNDRADTADRAVADLLVSVHADAHDDQAITGATIYVARAASQASVHAAKSVAQALHDEGIACNGIRRADFRVLARHRRPAILVECGYMTNPVESARLHDAGYRRRVARAIAAGIAAHFQS